MEERNELMDFSLYFTVIEDNIPSQALVLPAFGLARFERYQNVDRELWWVRPLGCYSVPFDDGYVCEHVHNVFHWHKFSIPADSEVQFLLQL